MAPAAPDQGDSYRPSTGEGLSARAVFAPGIAMLAVGILVGMLRRDPLYTLLLGGFSLVYPALWWFGRRRSWPAVPGAQEMPGPDDRPNRTAQRVERELE